MTNSVIFLSRIVIALLRDKMRDPSRTLAIDAGSSADDALHRVIGIALLPLLMGEQQTDYAGVAQRIVQASRPRDAVEEFLLRDVIDLTWEILRLRRLKAGTIKASMSDGVRKVLDSVGRGYSDLNRLSGNWAGGVSARAKRSTPFWRRRT
jgi:hypothetical protein